MKNLLLLMATSLFGLSVSAQTVTIVVPDADYVARRIERVQARAARNAADIKMMDSVVMSKGFVFTPDQFQQMPAGMPHMIYNPNFKLTIKPSYVDVDLPYIQNNEGLAPVMTSLNAIMPQVSQYSAVQTKDGWTVTFKTNAMTEYNYTFTLTITSITQEGVLTIEADQFNPVTYQGTISKLY